MVHHIRLLLSLSVLCAILTFTGTTFHSASFPSQLFSTNPFVARPLQTPRTVAFLNGQWFTDKGFEARTIYSVNGKFTMSKPRQVDRTIDLSGYWIIPPFGEGHNHNLNGKEIPDRKAIEKYLADGVFYVKLPGNFYLSDRYKAQLGLNTPSGIDLSLSQGATLTATGGHPYQLAEQVWLRLGYYEGSIDSLNGRRFFTIDSLQDLEKKWPVILKQKPDFIKVILWGSGEYQKRKQTKAYYGQFGLNPAFLPQVVAKAHASNLRVSVHVSDAYDFHIAVAAGVDEISHLPLVGLTPIDPEDAKLAARKGIVVVTTCTAVFSLPPTVLPKENLPKLLAIQRQNLALLHHNGVHLAIGSDNPSDSSVKEFEYLDKQGLFDKLTLLKLWTQNTPRAIFPGRRIGSFEEGYEASFLALEGNPLEDLQNVHRIKLRFKQGFVLEK